MLKNKFFFEKLKNTMYSSFEKPESWRKIFSLTPLSILPRLSLFPLSFPLYQHLFRPDSDADNALHANETSKTPSPTRSNVDRRVKRARSCT